jgi:hypothetical protein
MRLSEKWSSLEPDLDKNSMPGSSDIDATDLTRPFAYAKEYPSGSGKASAKLY